MAGENGKPESMTEVTINLVAASIASWGSYYMTKRKLRKLGAPEWAAWGFARTMQFVQAKALREQMHLSNEDISPVVQKWIIDHIDEIEAFIVKHPGIGKYVKIG